MCCNYRLLNQRHYAFNCKRVDLSADVPYLQHGRLLLSLPSRSWLPPCRRGSKLHLGVPGLAKQVSSPALTSAFKKACAPFTDVSPFFLFSSDVGLDAGRLRLSKSFAHTPSNLGSTSSQSAVAGALGIAPLSGSRPFSPSSWRRQVCCPSTLRKRNRKQMHLPHSSAPRLVPVAMRRRPNAGRLRITPSRCRRRAPPRSSAISPTQHPRGRPADPAACG
jgi:hypothetical protein